MSIFLFFQLEACVNTSSEADVFQCFNRQQCISEALHCDDVVNCGDGSDEIGCCEFLIQSVVEFVFEFVVESVVEFPHSVTLLTLIFLNVNNKLSQS